MSSLLLEGGVTTDADPSGAHHKEGRMRKSKVLRIAAALCALALVGAACSDDGDGGGSDEGRTVVRFAFSPDPVLTG